MRTGKGGATGAAVGATRGFAAESTTELGQTELEISMNPNLTEEESFCCASMPLLLAV